MNCTIVDIARKANVSIATVSRVMNGTGQVSEKTRKKVLKIIEEDHYVPNSVARSLVMKSTKIIGVIVADILNPFYAEIIRSIQDEVDKAGYSIISCNSDEDMEKEKQCIQMLMEKHVDAIILAGGRGKGEFFNAHVHAAARQLPVVLVNEYLDGENIYSIVCNKKKGAYLGINYLLELGHRDIAMITGYEDYKPSIEKLNGYKKALKEAGIPFRKEYVTYGDYHPDGGSNNVKELMALEKPPTAILAANDLMAMGAVRTLYDMGYRVPEDVSVIGFDDITMNQYFLPALTSIRQEMKLQGSMAVELLNQIFKEESGIKKKQVVEPSLVVRNTCAPFKRQGDH